MENYSIKICEIEGKEGKFIGFCHVSGLTLSISPEDIEKLSGEWAKDKNPFSYHFPKDKEEEEKMWDYFSSPSEMVKEIERVYIYARENKRDLLSFMETGFPMEVRETQNRNYNLPEIKQIIKEYPLYSQDGKLGEALVILKFFFPVGAATWWITEGNVINEGTEEEDIEFFGYVSGLVPGGDEFGYIQLSEIRDVYKAGLFIERDSYWTPVPLREAVPDPPAYWFKDKEPKGEK